VERMSDYLTSLMNFSEQLIVEAFSKTNNR